MSYGFKTKYRISVFYLRLFIWMAAELVIHVSVNFKSSFSKINMIGTFDHRHSSYY